MRLVLASFLLTITTLHPMQRSVFFSQNVPASSGGSSISYTNNNCGADVGSGSSVSCNIIVANSGDTVVAFSSFYYAGLGSVSASCGTATVVPSRTLSWNGSAEIVAVYVPNASAGTCTITITASGYCMTLHALDFAHANTAAPVDNVSCASSPYCTVGGTSPPPWAGTSITTANANEMVVSHVEFQNSGCGGVGDTLGATSPFTFVGNTGSSDSGTSYYLAASASTYTPSFSSTVNNGSGWVVTTLALKQ
jgi:hypothetical protein